MKSIIIFFAVASCTPDLFDDESNQNAISINIYRDALKKDFDFNISVEAVKKEVSISPK